MRQHDSQAGTRMDPSKSDGDYTPAGEDQGQSQTFTADDIARAFEVDVSRVHNALKGEFQLGTDAEVDSRQAQHLSEMILGDQPIDKQEAALMKLGAYTPRVDAAEPSVLEKRPGEQSDRIRPSKHVPEITAPREDGE